MSESILPMLSSNRFKMSSPTFRSLIHFEFIFVYGVRKCSNFILLHGAVQLSPEKAMAPHSSTLAWKIHGGRSLVGCSPWDCYESDTTERLLFHFSLSCIGGGNGNPLQYSCLENPGDWRAWWAAVYRVAQSWTRLT